jgi:hypothetical protein
MSTPFFFREATISDVNKKNMTCTLTYGDVSSGEVSTNVPMPNLAGAGNAGLISNLQNGTRVIAAYLHDTSREIVVIIAVLPSLLQREENTDNLVNMLIQGKSMPYPKTLENGDTYISAHSGPNIWLKSNDSLSISTMNGNGIFVIPNSLNNHNIFTLANNHSTEGSGGRLSWGKVKRAMENISYSTTNPFNTLLDRDSKLKDHGFWLGQRPSEISLPNLVTRNLSLSEYKLIINEFSTEYGFSGFDKEITKVKSNSEAKIKSPTSLRDRESTNSLGLSEGELIEIIGGNLVDIDGRLLDINYNPLLYGFAPPTVDFEAKMEEAAKKSRRGIGYHFKLSTNSKSSDIPNSLKDFSFDIDKEGVLKVNVPKSTGTGNIPYVSNVDFSSERERFHSLATANPSVSEKVPVMLRDRDGKIVDRKPASYRKTGVRFANLSGDEYFPSAANDDTDNTDKNIVRINTTRHHNISVAAERLIANYITKIHVPPNFAKEANLNIKSEIGSANINGIPKISSDPIEYSRHSAFQVLYKDKDGADDPNNKTELTNLLYSVVGVEPSKPAISTGGDTYVAGREYGYDNSEQPIISNYFKTSKEEDGIKVTTDKTLENVSPSGGVSANINMEGSLEMSIGSDSVDSKSLVLDTAGSLISWFGKDKNNRSMIVQTDGAVLFNVGGTYSNNKNITTFNEGRFDLRVNVTDQGFFDSDLPRSKNGALYDNDKPYSSDYIISISSEGMVIAGMKAGAPMVIRNDGPLMMESASNKLILKGSQVEIVEFAKTATEAAKKI